MKNKSSGITLTEKELQLVYLLNSLNGKARLEKIPMKKTSIMALSESLKNKNVLNIKKMERIILKPTEIGKYCVEVGLPEERLLKAILDAGGSIYMDELKKSNLFKDLKEINVAIGRCRKYGLISILKTKDKNNLIKLKKERASAEIPLREILKKIALENPEIDEIPASYVKELIRRGLIEQVKDKTYILELTDLGVAIAEGKVRVIKEVGALTRRLIETGRWKEVRLKVYDVSLEPPKVHPGKLHPYLEFLDEVREILIGMGFKEVKGPFVESEFWNFDVLFQPQDHPAREVHSSYILEYPNEANLKESDFVKRVKFIHENGWKTGSSGWNYKWSFDIAKRLILRTQTTAVSARVLATRKEFPLKIFSIDHVFRPDVLDRTHSMDFFQCEGVVLDRNLNIKHLLGFLASLVTELGFKKDDIRFVPAYFPFTEPSVETMIRHEELGWIEALGAGLFRPEVLAAFGIDHKEVSALAWGIGIDRLAMIKLGISDIRDLRTKNLETLREFERKTMK